MIIATPGRRRYADSARIVIRDIEAVRNGDTHAIVVSPTDYMPDLSLLPEVGAGVVDPRHIAVSLSATLRDHLLAQRELADASDDPAQRREMCTFVVVGAGYTAPR